MLIRYLDTTAEEENPDEFDPDEDSRGMHVVYLMAVLMLMRRLAHIDYSKITLPVFLCSSWDYNTIKG